MTNISASLVKELRDKTGAGMMDCKNALNQCKGSIEESVDWLRKKGLAAAQKKSGRIATEGLIGLSIDNLNGAIIEVNSETDFVARNETFQDFVKITAKLALSANGDINVLKTMKYPTTQRTVEEQLTDLVSTIGENISLRRLENISTSNGTLSSYVHSPLQEGVGKIGVLVSLQSLAEKSKLETLGKKLAMHIAASKPQAISQDDLNEEILARERVILTEQAKDTKRPDAIVEKIVTGRLQKFFEESCLLEQTYVMDNELKVSDAIELVEKEVGNKIDVTGFKVFVLGEGIEKLD